MTESAPGKIYHHDRADLFAPAVAIDAFELSNGNIAVVGTGFNDNLSTVALLDAGGSLVSNITENLPAETLAPGHNSYKP